MTTRITRARFLELLSAYRGKFGFDKVGRIRADFTQQPAHICPLHAVFGLDGNATAYSYINNAKNAIGDDNLVDAILGAADGANTAKERALRIDLLRALGLD